MNLLQLTDDELLGEIGGRLRRYRLQGNITQAELARQAGISLRTLGNIEAGRDVQLGTVIRILRALGRLDSLGAFLPEAGVSPMELLRSRGRPRQRAGGDRSG
ncbi:MAG: helix-turn-helix transcriptional regulator [Acidobacteria bacterium]|jgi:transcriptional regulator with XRE-family HTH domain|uniref:Helix-turn-helix transcriptional regulator n=1 Tax=Candidatus Polarisedimenticola svalbardensis TaxID=2886004 RepID=A0A8J7C2D9_9BACT|nr:helix-turn-helix transcriptional regulator [Candidatus Polarisedimenticola svalbardensis]